MKGILYPINFIINTIFWPPNFLLNKTIYKIELNIHYIIELMMREYFVRNVSIFICIWLKKPIIESFNKKENKLSDKKPLKLVGLYKLFLGILYYFQKNKNLNELVFLFDNNY